MSRSTERRAGWRDYPWPTPMSLDRNTKDHVGLVGGDVSGAPKKAWLRLPPASCRLRPHEADFDP